MAIIADHPFYDQARFLQEAAHLLGCIADSPDLPTTRSRLAAFATGRQSVVSRYQDVPSYQDRSITRDCARVLRHLVTPRSDELCGFSVVQALHDIARGTRRSDLGPGFFAEVTHLVRGLEGRSGVPSPRERVNKESTGRAAATLRSAALDEIASGADRAMERYPDGLQERLRHERRRRRRYILAALGGSDADWRDWRWQVDHVVREVSVLGRLVALSPGEEGAVAAARVARLPFGVTPYYLSLMASDPGEGWDRAIRAQVFPPASTVASMAGLASVRGEALDFMREADTSPTDLITRRYPGIVILKPFNTCPQICVYCQRNWEIRDAMDDGALASWDRIEAAIDWIRGHRAIHEVLVTGGDVLALGDDEIECILEALSEVGHVDLIRFGTRVPVTVPMRVTPALARLLGRYRRPGRREICVVTHVEHATEVTPDVLRAVDRLRRQGISVYNQLVYQFFVSRRFEAARLRMLLRRCGIEPYYSFIPKGKEETAAYRVPIARLLQEQKEEARLLPGLRRTDEPVHNVPGLGKNHLRAFQHRDLIGIRPDGSRVYEFHPWEKMVAPARTWVGEDVPILDYLRRLAEIGEDPRDYESIWYYY